MKKRTIFLAAAGALTGAALWWRFTSRRQQLPCPTWLAWLLDSPWSNALIGTRATLERINPQPGEHVLDVGAGPGRISLPAAERVGPSGQVVALDLQPGMLERLAARASAAGLQNITLRLADITAGDGLPINSFDRAWMVTVLGEIPDQQAAMRSIYQALKPGGILSITEFLPDPHFQPVGKVRRLARQAGFEPVEFWGNPLAFTQNFAKPLD